MKPSSTVVLDNGASTIKAGLVGDEKGCRIIPNAVVRSKGDKTTYFGHEMARCRDYSSLHYRLPFEKGYLVDWDAQKAVWDASFSSEALGINTEESSLLITEPYFNLPNIQDVYDQFVFEEYEFQSYFRCTPASMLPHSELFTVPSPSPPPECMLVIDSGFSFTHVIPILNGQIQWYAAKRLDIGGKLLTNQLKELVSYRQWNMMDETYIMNIVKESCCYVSSDFWRDLETCRLKPKSNPIVQEYVLPDFSIHRQGRIKHPADTVADTDQILIMESERFTIPELLFRPDDVGLEQSGLPNTIAASISLLPEDLRGMFWANIGLVGGNMKLPGLRERLLSELRSLAPIEYEVIIYPSKDPVLEAYNAALSFASSPQFRDCVVTRAEYLENGSNASRKKFRDWQYGEKSRDTDKGKARQRDEDDFRSQANKKITRTKSRSFNTTTRRR